LCAWILRSEAPAAGLSPDFRIADEDDSEELLRELGHDDARDKLYALHADASAVAPGCATPDLWYDAGFTRHRWARDYVAALSERGAVDFAGLVLLARGVLTADAARWERRFDAVCVDEVQDTHLSEYDVVRTLMRHARSRVFVGDLDQSIYGWRGSDPGALIARIEADLGPVRRFPLDESFRSTRALLRFADRVAGAFDSRATHVRPHPSLREGEPPAIGAFPDEGSELAAVTRGCGAAIARGVPPDRIAVLTRSNALAVAAGARLAAAGLPHATVERFRFFRRAEVKDALALFALAVDPRSEGAARRVAQRLVPGVGAATVSRLVTEGGPVGLRVADLLDPTTITRGDPLGGLDLREVVVLDTETTGLDPGEDEVVEIAAARIADGREVATLQLLVRPTRPVGTSADIHGLTDERLGREGVTAADAFARLAAFVGSTPIGGHNVRFDVAMITHHAGRVGVEVPLVVAFDTLAVARRLLPCPSYRLGDLARELDLAAAPSHRALDDVRATVALAGALRERAAPGAPTRIALVHRYAAAFAPIREAVAGWRALDVPPSALLRRVVADADLRASLAAEPERLANLDELEARIRRIEGDGARGPEAARDVLERVSLVRDVDLVDDEPGVRVLTVHQAKGMEFDEVFVPGLVDNGFPTARATESGNVEEERRLFYVAITRARRRLHLSWAARGGRGYATRPSRFLPGGPP
jgi:DNA helicase-2/ATP-dependent DNA helicase PcrA